MWNTLRTQLSSPSGFRLAFDRDGQPATYQQILDCWRDDADFRSMFGALLADMPFRAFRWETPPVTAANVDRPFEFVVIDSPGLERPADANAFDEHFANDPDSAVVTFDNLGKDATLVVPSPATSDDAYPHLAAFVRHAPTEQQHELWISVSKAMARRLTSKPVWLSTAGAGVAWLHVRLDDRPKYYSYVPYRST